MTFQSSVCRSDDISRNDSCYKIARVPNFSIVNCYHEQIIFRRHLGERSLPNRQVYFARWKNFMKKLDWLVVFAAKDTDIILKRFVDFHDNF